MGPQMNGWYRRREAAEGPPEGHLHWDALPRTRAFLRTSSQEKLYERTLRRGCDGSGGPADERVVPPPGGRPWYEKDDGCYICWDSPMWWHMRDGDGNHLYDVTSTAALPPAAGWYASFY